MEPIRPELDAYPRVVASITTRRSKRRLPGVRILSTWAGFFLPVYLDRTTIGCLKCLFVRTHTHWVEGSRESKEREKTFSSYRFVFTFRRLFFSSVSKATTGNMRKRPKECHISSHDSDEERINYSRRVSITREKTKSRGEGKRCNISADTRLLGCEH